MSAKILIAATLIVAATITQAQWQLQDGPLKTRWAHDVSPERVHPEYPRPQLVRTDWQSLNGLWQYAVRPKPDRQPQQFDGRILVPFPIESALSGVMKRVDEQQRLWYRRTFELPATWGQRRVRLHFEAVDWETTVWVNKQELGTHRGGYDPFSFDITDALRQAGPQELVVAVWDPIDAGPQPRGKQVRSPSGIWYTPTTGIWQTVWLEPVPNSHIAAVRFAPDVDHARIGIKVELQNPLRSDALDVAILADGREVLRGDGLAQTDFELPNPHLWSPDDPFLYEVRVTLRQWDAPDQVRDQVTSYFGLRKSSLGPDAAGRTRLLLNNKPLFMFGPLDQGYWPDGLYTAPTDEALRYDLDLTKQLGCNLIRKHVKIEPRRWYYWCDKLGLLVWQDMPSGDRDPAQGQPEIKRSPESAAQYELELKRLIEARGDHPCIVMWVPFNEGWGQYDTRRVVDFIKRQDPTRLVNSASGWNDVGAGDVHDVHAYPGPAAPPPEPGRAAVLGEFGGLGLPVAGHIWQAEKSWGYKSYQTSAELTTAYLNLVQSLRLLIAEPGLSAAVYTQTTDVETEVNGLLTYDRALVKVDAQQVASANRKLYLPPLTVTSVAPTSERAAQAWRHTSETPPANWFAPDFVDTAWREGPAPFGRDGTPGLVVGTPWLTPDIWIRRHFDVQDSPRNPHARLYYDEDCEVYIDGQLVISRQGYTTSYVLIPLPAAFPLKAGKHLLAVHCQQTAGGQGVDAGIVEIVDPPRPWIAAGSATRGDLTLPSGLRTRNGSR